MIFLFCRVPQAWKVWETLLKMYITGSIVASLATNKTRILEQLTNFHKRPFKCWFTRKFTYRKTSFIFLVKGGPPKAVNHFLFSPEKVCDHFKKMKRLTPALTGAKKYSDFSVVLCCRACSKLSSSGQTGEMFRTWDQVILDPNNSGMPNPIFQ